VTNGYYDDGSDDDDDDEEEYAGKAIDAVYSADQEPVSILRDKSADDGDRQSHPKDNGSKLLRSFMRHSGEHQFRRRDAGGTGGEKGKYFAGESSMKASRRQERDERKRRAKEEKREKRSERKLKRMDKKLVAVGVSKRKLDKYHEGNNIEDERADTAASEDERKTSRMLAFRRKRRSMSEIEPSRDGSGIKGRDAHAAAAGSGGGGMAQRTMTASGKVPHAGARRMTGGLGGSMELTAQDMAAGGGIYSGEGRVKRAFERRVQEAKKRIGRKNKNMERKASTAETNATLDVEAFLQDNIGTDWREKVSQRDDASTLTTAAHVTTARTLVTSGHIDHTPAAVAVASAVASATTISNNKEQDASPLGKRHPPPSSPNVVRRNVVGELPDSIWNVRPRPQGRRRLPMQSVS
jgi:hypothetical protein